MHDSTLPAPRRFNRLPHLAAALLVSSSLVRCSCDDTPEFIPSARYVPEVLDFGEVSVASEKILSVEVQSVGSAGLQIVDALVDDPDGSFAGKFTVVVADDLTAGLAPGGTSTVTVTYRPCPDAWNGAALKENFDYNDCPSAPDATDLSITDNTVVGTARIPLSGRPVQPPVASIFCPMGQAAMTCNDSAPNLIECNGINFGTVNGGEPPCDLVMEVTNAWRNNKPVSDLMIDKIEVIVKELNTGALITDTSGLFEVLDMDGNPLQVDADNPFLVEIDPGGDSGASRFKLRFTGAQSGLYRGETSSDTGLRLYTNDPDHPILTAPLTAIGSAPDLTILIDNKMNFGPVEQGTTRTSTRTLNNFGDATLTISGMAIESGNSEFEFTTSKGTNFPITIDPNEQVILRVNYTPGDTGTDLEKLVITSNDPDPTAPGFVEIRGGAVPSIEVNPADVLVFALPQPTPPPPLPPRTECLTVSNTGYGDLIINQLEMVGADGTRTHSSVDDFTIDNIPACSAANPCDPDIVLCAPTDPACTMSSTDICITYDNNDVSTTDQVSLIISSNDPSNPTYTVVLQASDVPCFFPTPNIQVVTPRPCVGQAVELSASNSDPGGDGTGQTAITKYTWSFGFAQPDVSGFMPPDAVQTQFIPQRGGLYIVNLELENSCGARSQGPGQEQIIVAETGCN